MKKLKIAVLFGGYSSEHEVSLMSATSIINNLPRNLYEVIPVGITKNGHWLYYPGSTEKITDGTWSDDLDCCPAVVSPDRTHKGLLKLLPDKTQVLLKVDCVFPALHGKNGEDGSIQGLLQLSGIPYVGCGVLSSAICMDKAMTHTVLDHVGILNAKWRALTKSDLSNLSNLCREFANDLGFPVFIKPANAGSSVGITKAYNMEDLRQGILTAFSHDDKVLCEQTISGKEIECAVLGNENPKASILGQIISCNDFYDYDAKYQSDSQLLIPAQLSDEQASNVQRTAVQAYKTLGCRGLARMDFFVEKNGTIILNEPNTLPGFTKISMYPKLWEKSHISYPNLLQCLIELALSAKTEFCV